MRAAGLRFTAGRPLRGMRFRRRVSWWCLPSGGDDPGSSPPDEMVLADAWLPDMVLLGELERHLGDGVIEAIVDETVAQGRLFVPRGTGPAARPIPFTREWHVPMGKVVTDWRVPVPRM